MSVVTDGIVHADCARAFLKRTPSFASASMCGLVGRGLPKQPRWSACSASASSTTTCRPASAPAKRCAAEASSGRAAPPASLTVAAATSTPAGSVHVTRIGRTPAPGRSIERVEDSPRASTCGALIVSGSCSTWTASTPSPRTSSRPSSRSSPLPARR
jgi:hypothetical protein